MTVGDVLHDNDEVSIRLGDPPTPVPEPIAGWLLTHIDNQLNLTTDPSSGNSALTAS
ncbi:hypothetical protein ACIHDR_48890 [Nocardia sp. NPDC052278]|uniref:hypothetical protein n=1 Tax=unclassified Nocardia TaxID=2637762 RepID=UPI0036746AF9